MRAQEILSEQNCACVVVRGEQVRTAEGIGVKPLMAFLREDRECFRGASVADRVIGKAAAMLLAAGGAAEVYGRVMSESAMQVLQRAGIPYSCAESVPFIKNRAGTGMCPLEDAVDHLDDPADAFAALEKRIAELMQQK